MPDHKTDAMLESKMRDIKVFFAAVVVSIGGNIIVERWLRVGSLFGEVIYTVALIATTVVFTYAIFRYLNFRSARHP